MTRAHGDRVVFQPSAHQRFGAGVKTLIDIVRPTLGPRPRLVAVSPNFSDQKPELLDDGGTIARRVIQLADRDEDTGAMFVRHMLWRLKEQVGDGTATAAVLFGSLYEQGVRYISAGGNPQQLRRHLEHGIESVLDELATMTVQREGKEKLAQIAEATCHDPQLANLMGEIFDIIGGDGRIEIRAGRGLTHEREYVEGLYYDDSGVLSRYMLPDAVADRIDLEDAAIVLSDLHVTEPHDLRPVIALAVAQGVRALVIMVSQLADEAIPWVLAASREPQKLHVIAVKTPARDINVQAAALEDLAVLTGGRPLLRAAGDSLRAIRVEHLGRARRIWASRQQFGVVGGKGDARKLRGHIATLRNGFKQAEEVAFRTRLQERIGKLLGGSATLYIGGLSEHDINAGKEIAERTAEALRGALREGVVPGGGMALMRCRSAIERMAEQAGDETERVAWRILARALEEPFRAITANAGYDPSEVLAAMQDAPSEAIFDVRTGGFVDAAAAGIFDVAAVQKAAVYHAIRGAALALTIDVLVHPKRPIVSVNP